MQKYITQFGITVAAVLVVLLGFQLYQRLTIHRHVNAVYLVQGLAAAGPVKAAVVQYYHEYGQMPASNAEVGLPAPTEFVGKALESIEVSWGGELILTFNEQSGVDQGWITLTPDLTNPMLSSWTCTTPTYRKIQKLVPQCEYQE